MTDKLCHLCQKILPFAAFRIDKKSGKHLAPCQVCHLARRRERDAAKPRKATDRTRATYKAWRKAHPGYTAAATRKWREGHREQDRAQNNANKRVQRRPALRAAVFLRDGNACLCCGAVAGLVIDHIIPVLMGGMSGIDNLQTLCRSCNSAKRGAVDYRKRTA